MTGGKMMRRSHLAGLLLAGLFSSAVHAAEWDSIRGSASMLGEPDEHWFTVRQRHSAYVVDGDEGAVKGTLTLSMFSPAVRSHLDAGLIYAYGSFYTRTYYGDRSDFVLLYDAESLNPVAEVEIPPKSAGIGHSGMIGLINDRFVGVWNITPAMSVSIVDTEAREFVGEISTPGCAAVYPIADGFLMPCGDGALQYITLDDDGEETSRTRSEVFFSVEEDPVYDYAVPTGDGWMFMSLDGNVFTASVVDGEIVVSEPFSIFADEEEEGWRIGGRQPFAYNAETGLLVTLMHQGGGQETFEDGGRHVWAFSMNSGRRGYVIELDEESRGVQLTPDASPLMVMGAGGALRIHDGLTGRHLRTIDEMGGGLVQPLR
jgi:methylamine dehydrogenase heavy chain